MKTFSLLAVIAVLPSMALAADCTVASLDKSETLQACAERMLKSRCRDEIVSALRTENGQWPEPVVQACCAHAIQSFDPPVANICNPNVAMTSETVAERALAKLFKGMLSDKRVGLDAPTVEKASLALARRLTANTAATIPTERQCPALTILLSFKPEGAVPNGKHAALFPTGATATGPVKSLVLEDVVGTLQALRAYAAQPELACARGSPRPLVVLVQVEEEYRSQAKSLIQALRASGSHGLYLGAADPAQDDLKMEPTPWPRL